MKISKLARAGIALICLSALTMQMLSACSQGEEKSAVDGTAATVGAEESGEISSEKEFSIYDTLPAADFGGETFVIYNPPNPDSPVDKGTTAEEMNGEVFNDTVFQRNKLIEEKFNVVIKTFSGKSWDSAYGDLRKVNSAGLTDYDVVYTHIISNISSFVSENLVQDWQKVPHVDFSQPWWNKSTINSMIINGKSYYASGSMHIHDPLVLIDNKNLIRDLGLDNPYDLVKSGEWTIDKLAEMAKAASFDLNGDGKFDDDDRYGLEYGKSWQIPSLFYASGMQPVIGVDTGAPKVNLNNTKVVEIYEKVYNLFYDGNQTLLFGGSTTQENNFPRLGIESGRVLFTQYNLFTCENLRQTEIDYGILPMPKYNKEQAGYISNSWTGMMVVPSYIVDEARLSRIGIIMEAMAAEGYSKVLPVYYDVVLKEKYARDEDSRHMLDIIMDSIVYDIGLSFNDAGGAGTFMSGLLNSKKQNFTSEIEKSEAKIQAALDKVFVRINEL